MKIVKFEVPEDKNFLSIGLMEGEQDPSIEVNAKFGKEEPEVLQFTADTLVETAFIEQLQKEQTEDFTFEVDDAVFEPLRKQKIVVGPVMIPKKLIFKANKPQEGKKSFLDNEPYVGYFSAEDILKVKNSAGDQYLTDNFDINHDGIRLSDIFIIKSWIIDDLSTDESRKYGYNLPLGTWMIMVKVANEEIYNKLVKSGTLNGFSVETMAKRKPITE